MKKILILIFFLSLFNFSFSWEKIAQQDEFGDLTNNYILYEGINNGELGIMVQERNVILVFSKRIRINFSDVNIPIKIKSERGIDTVTGVGSGKMIFFFGEDVNTILTALRDYNLLKFSLNHGDYVFEVSGVGFTKLYKEACWQNFTFGNPINKPPKGELIWCEKVGYVEAEDLIWYWYGY